jgi:hypothetical protein
MHDINASFFVFRFQLDIPMLLIARSKAMEWTWSLLTALMATL